VTDGAADCRPRGSRHHGRDVHRAAAARGVRHRWVDTELEPYISVAICAGIALSFTMTLSGVLNLLG
jgi:hypothetical protein